MQSDFNQHLNELAAISTQAHQDFTAIGVQKVCKVFISTNSKCEAITNNLSDTFNGCILKATSKHIIDMLEDIRRLVMARMQAKRELILRSNDEICPNIRKKLEKNKRETRCCHVTPAGNLKFEVQQMERSHVVNLSNCTCSCRYWDISGIPCNHAISCIVWLKEDPDNYVDNYYKKEAYLKTYEFLMEPLTGKDTWPQVEGPHVLPPPVKKMPGRPKKKRRREVHEEESSSRLSKRGVVMSCSLCKQDGHNRRSCPLRALASPSATDIEAQIENSRRTRPSSSRGKGRTTSGRVHLETDISVSETDIYLKAV
ncbi:hypothetical protein Cni_G29170 [Canna indica]|uniref:SWIM-type domain-containing protein n=1 Tax=Canna indica TaxID=4628 RepID=A0AAQ3L4U4_9LILI|nr:hypothetical protein Cni_G29170 [Canna indica]